MSTLLQRLTAKRAPAPETGHVEADVVTAALAHVPSYCDVVTAHLSDVVEETDDAAQSLVTQLTAVDSLAEVMAGDVQGLAGTLQHTQRQLGEASDANVKLVDRLIRYF